MKTRLKLFIAGMSMLIAVSVGTGGRSSGTAPCPPYRLVDMTGTLVEVRRDGALVTADDPLMSVLPRVVCLSPQDATSTVVVRDCYEPQYKAIFRVTSP